MWIIQLIYSIARHLFKKDPQKKKKHCQEVDDDQ